MRNIIGLATAALIILVLSISCGETQQSSQMTLSGRVTETDTTVYLGGVIVSDGAVIDTTDESGFFELTGISIETHTVTFEKDGFVPTSIDIGYAGNLERPIVSRRIVMEKAESTE